MPNYLMLSDDFDEIAFAWMPFDLIHFVDYNPLQAYFMIKEFNRDMFLILVILGATAFAQMFLS